MHLKCNFASPCRSRDVRLYGYDPLNSQLHRSSHRLRKKEKIQDKKPLFSGAEDLTGCGKAARSVELAAAVREDSGGAVSQT